MNLFRSFLACSKNSSLYCLFLYYWILVLFPQVFENLNSFALVHFCPIVLVIDHFSFLTPTEDFKNNSDKINPSSYTSYLRKFFGMKKKLG